MRRFTVLGFTEAELGFVLAALFAAMAVGAAGSTDSIEDEIARVEAERDSVEAARDAATAQRDSVALAFQHYRDSVAAADAKRSTKTPRCTEKGEPPDAVADVRILGSDRYGWNGAQLNWVSLQARLAPLIARSDSLGCRYLLIARASSGVQAGDHTEAVARLLQYFDVAHRAR